MSAAELRVLVAIVLAALVAVVASFHAEPAVGDLDGGPVAVWAAPVGTDP